MAPDPKHDLLSRIPLFAGLGSKQLEALARLLDEVDVPAGQVLMRQGEPGAEMFIVVDGQFSIERDGAMLRTAGPGEALGELALLTEGPRTATVTATTPARLFVAGHRQFHALLEVAPEISLAMLEALGSRIRSLDRDAVS